MRSKDAIEVNVRFDWRILLAVVVLGMLFWGYSAARAQSGSGPDTNSIQQESPANLIKPNGQAPLKNDLVQCDEGLIPTINGECLTPGAVGSAPASDLAAGSVTATNGAAVLRPGDRHFYLTVADVFPANALTACSAGYHMASLWEILDVSNLTYDAGLADAFTKADSGFGPPSQWYGWVRTGEVSSGVNSPGAGNCLNWTSSDSANYGVSARLSSNWAITPGGIGPWEATSFTCSLTGPVWCVKD